MKVVGIGSGGSRTIERAFKEQIPGIDFVIVDTDKGSLSVSDVPTRIQIGKQCTAGIGTGGNPELGRKAAEETADGLYQVIKDSDIIFVAAGLGGGTGTGAAPIICQMAKEANAITIGVVTRPFTFEGVHRQSICERGISLLKEQTHTLIVIPNDRLLQLVNKQASMIEAYKMADSVFIQFIRGVSELITVPGKINVANLRAIFLGGDAALIGFGQASGEERARKAAEEAISNRMLDITIDGAKGIIFRIVGGSNLTLFEVNQIAAIIRETAHPDVNLVFDTITDEKMGDEIRVIVVATGFGSRSLPRRILQQPSYERSSVDDIPSFFRNRRSDEGISKNIVNQNDLLDSTQSVDLNKPKRNLRIFLCYSSGDKVAVNSLYRQLSKEENIDVWIDEKKLLPGEHWDFEIKRAVRESDIVIVCLTNQSINKEGYVQKEIKQALDVADEKPEGAIFVVPLKLEECQVPYRLRTWQWLNYFEENSYKKLMLSLQKRAATLGIQIK